MIATPYHNVSQGLMLVEPSVLAIYSAALVKHGSDVIASATCHMSQCGCMPCQAVYKPRSSAAALHMPAGATAPKLSMSPSPMRRGTVPSSPNRTWVCTGSSSRKHGGTRDMSVVMRHAVRGALVCLSLQQQPVMRQSSSACSTDVLC